MEKKLYEGFNQLVTRLQMGVLEEVSKLFSENYGVWSEHAA